MLAYSEQQPCLQIKTNHKQDTGVLNAQARFLLHFLFPSSPAMTLCASQNLARITGGEHLDDVCVCVCVCARAIRVYLKDMRTHNNETGAVNVVTNQIP